jgi:class 3 adenylate cyclase
MTEEGKLQAAPLERRVLAIMATDVVGYSRQMEADENGTIQRVTGARAEIIEPLLERHHGRLVKLIGDGTLSLFESVVDAVTCAAAIQRALRQRNGAVAEAERMVLRIGINLGDVALLENDVYGDGVNVAARIESLCDAGGIMVSGTAYDHLQGKLDFPLEFVGEQQVKNIERPVRTYRARLGGVPVQGRQVDHAHQPPAAGGRGRPGPHRPPMPRSRSSRSTISVATTPPAASPTG